MKRSLVVGGSIGATILLLVLSFHSVIASDVNRQMINNENKINRSAINFNLFRNYLQKNVLKGPIFDIFDFLSLLAFIFHMLISWFLWIIDHWSS